MAAKKPSKSASADKVAIQLNVAPEIAARLKHVAIGLNQSMSEVVTGLVLEKFGSVHLRGLGNSTGAGQGASGQLSASPAVVSISPVSDRISAIHRRATLPVDNAIDLLTTDHS
jgi:hypothetical protein